MWLLLLLQLRERVCRNASPELDARETHKIELDFASDVTDKAYSVLNQVRATTHTFDDRLCCEIMLCCVLAIVFSGRMEFKITQYIFIHSIRRFDSN